MINHDNSFLSSHVQKLLKRIKFDSNLFKYSSKCFIIKNNLIFLDFNYLNKERISNSILFNDDNSILEDDFDNDEERMFIKASKNIQFISRCVEFYFKNVSRINNIYQYESNETYINDDYDILLLFNKLHSDPMLLFILLCTKLERYLGDIFFSITDGKVQTPRMLKDLLSSEALTSFIGNDIIFILNAFVGSPIGMNLRNIMWHGFINPDEFDNHYNLFIIVLIYSISYFTYGKIKSFKRRSFFSFSNLKESSFDFGKGERCFNKSNIMNYRKELDELFSKSSFIHESRREIFKNSLNYLNDDLLFTSLMFPQLEHSLRYIYVKSNQLPYHYLCAETRQHYTTIDIILDKNINENDPNMIHSVLNDHIIAALYDLYIYPNSLRIRDRISHGECENVIPSIYTDKLLGIIVYLCLEYSSNDHLFHKYDLMNHVINYYNEYVPCFSIKSLIQRNLLNIYPNLLELIKQIELLDNNLNEFKRRIEYNDIYEYIYNLNNSIYEQYKGKSLILNEIFKLKESNDYYIITSYDNINISFIKPLFSSPDVNSCLSMIQKITFNIHTLTDKLITKYKQQYDDIISKAATSRLQNSFYKLIGHIDIYLVYICTLCLYLSSQLVNNKIFENKKVLKKISLSIDKINRSVNDNKWINITEQISECIKYIV